MTLTAQSVTFTILDFFTILDLVKKRFRDNMTV